MISLDIKRHVIGGYDLSEKVEFSYFYLILLSMPYMAIMLCNSILTNRYIGTDNFYILGGTLTSPFVFVLDNIIAEVYGFRVARSLIYIGYSSQLAISLIFSLVVSLPYPHELHEYRAYQHILGWSMVRIVMSGFFAYMSANLLNSYLISRWKVLVKGRYFIIRSVGASLIAEALYTLIAIFMMEVSVLSYADIFHVSSLSFIIKLLYSFVLAYPSSLVVKHIQFKTGVDVYDFPRSLTPFKETAQREDHLYEAQ